MSCGNCANTGRDYAMQPGDRWWFCDCSRGKQLAESMTITVKMTVRQAVVLMRSAMASADMVRQADQIRDRFRFGTDHDHSDLYAEILKAAGLLDQATDRKVRGS